ncbi:MAG: transketolase-like TK C-terminal-containing protein [Betaproteobacteria bacterium]
MPDTLATLQNTVIHAPSVRDADLANSIRALAMDAVEAAKSGHPGMPMGAGSTGDWHRYVGAADDAGAAVVGIDRFGESAPAGVLFQHFGFTVDHVAAVVRQVAGHSARP